MYWFDFDYRLTLATHGRWHQKFLYIPLGLILIFHSVSWGQIRFSSYSVTNVEAVGRTTAIADLNNDGRNDVVFATEYIYNSDKSCKIHICLQGEDGRLLPPLSYDYPSIFPSLTDLVVEDINGDGLNDVVIAYDQHVGIFYQHAEGGFGNFASFDIGRYVKYVRAADLNQDGRKDIVVTADNHPYLRVLYQRADGFELKPVNEVEAGIDGLEVADLDADGKPEVVFFSNYTFKGIGVLSLREAADETKLLQFPIPPDLINVMFDMAIDDLNGDGKPDVVVSNWKNPYEHVVGIWYQSHSSGALNLEPPVNVPMETLAGAVSIADLDCDGTKEIIIGNNGYLSVSILERDDNGIYAASNKFFLPMRSFYWPQDISVGDLDGDGRKDLAVADNQGLVVLRNLSAPKLFDEIKTEVVIDTLRTFKSESRSYAVAFRADTMSNRIVHYKDSLQILQTVQYDDIKTDTLIYRSGKVCGKVYRDTLRTTHTGQFRSIRRDTTILHTEVTEVPFFKIYPNPTPDILYIEISEQFPEFGIRLYTHSGTLIFEDRRIRRKNQNTISLTSYPPGIYLLELTIDRKRFIARVLKSG